MSTQSEPMSLDEIIEDSQITSTQANKFSSFKNYKSGDLRSISELHPKFRHIFQYPYFNKIQSKVFDDVLYTDNSLVVSAPTGSGKTVLLELAIVRLLMILEELKYTGDFKIVYMAPVKALCTERLSDWYGKFSKLGLPCIEVTGDTDSLDFGHLKFYKIIMTTPEKWDSLTRRWKDHKLIVQMVKLFIIDEVHLLNEDVRGPVLEAVVSRMKTIQSSLKLSKYSKKNKESMNMNNLNIFEEENMTEINIDSDDSVNQLSLDMRFIAVSATIPNAEDIAEWLGTKERPAACYKIGEEYRPVKLKKIVEGFPFKDGQGLFKFDMYLSYKLRPIIERYCDGKPTLIFCNTRKSVVMTAEVLSRELMFQFSQEQSSAFAQMASRLSEKKLQVLVRSGIGCHHAGFIQSDRNIIEQMFRLGDLPLLVTTSTLAMGVNLPAHLVIIKTTQFYNNGAYQEYEESTVLQMMGRAGRPQFDTEGVAVILTKSQDKNRYVSMCGGTRCVESALHRHLSEHLNAEAALGTLADLLQAMDWIRSTFLYVRAVRNPSYYGYSATTSRDTIEKRLEELCLKCVNALARAGMLTMDSNTVITSTEAGMLMSAHYLDFETMKLIIKMKGTETLSGLLGLLSMCHEYCDVPLRAGEKRCLNLLNRRPRGQAADGAVGSCRFPLPGRIQTRDMKVNCLIQAIFGSLPIPDPSLNQEATKVLRIGDHISKCILNYTTRPSALADNVDKPIYQSVLNSVILAKCFAARLWENSCFMVRQLNGIGPTFAALLVSAGKTTFESIRQSNPRDLERIMNKLPPTGNILKKQVALLPLYELDMKCEPNRVVQVTLSIANYDQLLGQKSTAGENHSVTLVIGDSENNLLLFEKILDRTILESDNNEIKRRVTPKSSLAHTVNAHCISNTWVGLDVKNSIIVKKTLFSSLSGIVQQKIQQYVGKHVRGSMTSKHADEIIQEEVMEALADFSSQIQTDFLNEENDIFESKDDQQKKKDMQDSSIKKKPRKASNKQKISVQKNYDVAKGGKNMMEKINKNIKSIPEPSHLNTLSPNVTYYRPLPKSTPQNCSVNFKSKENTLSLNEPNVMKGSGNYNANTLSICTSNPCTPRVQNNSSYYINRTQQQNIETDMDKPANTHSLNTNSYVEDMESIRSSEKYSSWPDHVYEHNPVIEDILNSSEDETYEGWYKKLDTQNTRHSFVSKMHILQSFSSQIDDSSTNHSITEREIMDRGSHYNYLTSSESQLTYQQNNEQEVVTPSGFSKRNYLFEQNTENVKNTRQYTITNDPDKYVFENNKQEAPNHYETLPTCTLQSSEKYNNPESIDFTQNRPAYKGSTKRIVPQTETSQHSTLQFSEKFNNPESIDLTQNRPAFKGSAKRIAPETETFQHSSLQFSENYDNPESIDFTQNRPAFKGSAKRIAPETETFQHSSLQFSENYDNPESIDFTQNRPAFKGSAKRIMPQTETFQHSTLQFSEKFNNPKSIDFTQNRPAYKGSTKRIVPQTETFQHSTLQFSEKFKNPKSIDLTQNRPAFKGSAKRIAPKTETFQHSSLQFSENYDNPESIDFTQNRPAFKGSAKRIAPETETFQRSSLQFSENCDNPESIDFIQNRPTFKVSDKRIAPETETFKHSAVQFFEKYNNLESIDFTKNRPAYKGSAKRIAPQTETFQQSNNKNHFNKINEEEISICYKNQWTVPKISTNVHTSPGSSEKINFMNPNDSKRIISYVDLTEDLETIQRGENDFIKIDSVNKETKPNNTTFKVSLEIDNYSKKPSSTITKKLEDESKNESAFNNKSLNTFSTTLNQSLNSVDYQNILDLSKNVCEKAINNLSTFDNKLEKTQTAENNVCDEKLTNAIHTQISSIDYKQNKTMLENLTKDTERKKIACQSLPVCEIVNTSDCEMIVAENFILPKKKSELTAENSTQSEDSECEIVNLNFLDKIQCYKPEGQSPKFYKMQNSVQQNNGLKPTNVNIKFGNQIHITNNFQKLHCITFNTVPRPFTFAAYPRRHRYRKFKSVTWRAPLILLPPRASNILPGNVINEIQIQDFSLVKKNLLLIKRNHKFKEDITAKKPIMSVMKSVMELPLKELLSLYSFNTANNIIEISANENIGKTMCNSSQNKIRELEDIEESSPLKKDQHKPIIELSNCVNTLQKIAGKEVSQIIESNMTDAGNEVDIIREVSSSSESKTELLFAEPSKKICNKELYVKEWLTKSPFNCFPNLDPDTSESQTAFQEIEITKDSEGENSIKTANANHSLAENMFTTMITSSLLRNKQKYDSEKVVDENNDVDGIEDLESTWETDCKINKKLANTNKVRSSESKKSQKQSINSVMNNYNAENDWNIYRDSPNKREIFQRTAIKEPKVRLENDGITSDYQHSLPLNYVTSTCNILKNDAYIRFDSEDNDEDWIHKFDEDLASQNMYDSDNNEIIDQNLFNPQNMIASAYCSNRNMDDSEMVNLSQGEYGKKTTSELSFQLFQHKILDSVKFQKNYMKRSYNDNSFNNSHIPSTIESENSENLPKYHESGKQGSHLNIIPINLGRYYESGTQNAGQNQYTNFNNVSNDYSRSLFGNCNYNYPLAAQSNVNMDRTQHVLEAQSQPSVNVSAQRFHFQNNNNQGQYQFRSQVHRQNISGNLFLSQFEKPLKNKIYH